MIALATWGLFLAWLLHDIEELITMPGWGGRNADRLRRRNPRVPGRSWARMNLSRPQVSVAITIMGLFMLAAAADGARSAGTSGFYQTVLVGFGVHGVGHLGQSALTHGYTPGVVTAPVIVIPFSLWAWRAIEHANAESPVTTQNVLAAIVLLPAVLIGVHGLAWAILWTARRTGSHRI